MKQKNVIWALIIIIILGGGYWYYSMNKTVASAAPANSTVATDMGTYPYECDEHVMMSVTPSADMSTITISGTDGAAYPPKVTLAKATASSGVKYQGGEFTFTGKGESVTITQGDQSLNCSPVANPDAAPFNFGD